LQLRAFLPYRQQVDGHFPLVFAGDQFEAILQQALQHCPQRLGRVRIRRRIGKNIEPVGIQPDRPAEHHFRVHAVGLGD